MKKLIFATLLLLFAGRTHAQFDFDPSAMIDKLFGTIESDRPGQALNAKTCGMLSLQIQTGFHYNENKGGFADVQNLLVPTNIRVGLTRKLELNTSFSYLKNTYTWPAFGWSTTDSGFLSPELGFRYNFLKGDRWKPLLSLQANVSFISHKGDFQQQNVGSSFYLLTSNRFDVFSVNTNFGVKFYGDGSMDPSAPWVVNFGFNLADKWAVFIEGFGDFVPPLSGIISSDFGVSYQPFSDLQIDAYGGFFEIINFGHRNWFAEIGVSYRFSFLKVLAKKKAGEMMEMFKG